MKIRNAKFKVVCASGRKNIRHVKTIKYKMPENSKFEIVYALQGARTLKNMKFKVQNSELSRAPPFSSALPLFQLFIDSIFGTSVGSRSNT